MDENDPTAAPPPRGRFRAARERIGRRGRVRSAALVAAGMIAGGILAGTITAAAVDGPGRAFGHAAEDGRGHGGHRGHGGGAGEEELTGATATSVREAVLEEYPDATIERLETDADGTYEAHILTEDGEDLTVELDEDFAITGTEE